MMMLRYARRIFTSAGLVVVLTLAACGSSPHASAPAQTGTGRGSTADTIVIKNFMFSPASLTVSPGTVITIRNEDSVTHTLTDKANPKLFGTGDIGPGQMKKIKAPGSAGRYAYICQIHQYMSGTLVVS